MFIYQNLAIVMFALESTAKYKIYELEIGLCECNLYLMNPYASPRCHKNPLYQKYWNLHLIFYILLYKKNILHFCLKP